MTQPLSDAAASLRQAGDALAEAAGRLDRIDPGMRVFGGDGPGRLGALGRDLHRRWQRALDARVREVAGHAVRLDGLAMAAARAADSYAQTDEAAGRRQPEEP